MKSHTPDHVKFALMIFFIGPLIVYMKSPLTIFVGPGVFQWEMWKTDTEAWHDPVAGMSCYSPGTHSWFVRKKSRGMPWRPFVFHVLSLCGSLKKSNDVPFEFSHEASVFLERFYVSYACKIPNPTMVWVWVSQADLRVILILFWYHFDIFQPHPQGHWIVRWYQI